MAAVDRCLSRYNADLAANAQVLPGLDARLVQISPDQNIDNYCILQGLSDKRKRGTCYLYQRWGRTGTAGECKVDGPMEKEKVEEMLAAVFKEKTGSDWGELQPGDRVPDGKYWLQQKSQRDAKAQWQYYVGDGVDGKRDGWYPYTAEASEEVEEIYSQHVANQRESRTASRLVHSGYFTYRVDLGQMTQQNTRTKKERQIRRMVGDSTEGGEPMAYRPPPGKAVKAKMKPMRKAPKTKRATTTMKAVRTAKKAMKSVKKPMKKASPMKKRKKKSTVAKGRVAMWLVFKGAKLRTSGGLRASDLVKNVKGKIVSKKMQAHGFKCLKYCRQWTEAFKRARKELGLVGFVLITKGSPLYIKTKEIFAREGAPPPGTPSRA